VDFGLLRSLAHHPPTPRAWDAICLALEVMGDEPAHAHRREYLLWHITRRWPMTLRRCPPRWIEQLLYQRGDWRWSAEGSVPGPPGCWLRAVGELDVMMLPLPISPGDLGRLLRSPWLSHIERIRWRAASVVASDFDLTHTLPSLRVLDMVYTGALAGEPVANALAQVNAFPSLQYLRMERFSLGDDGVLALSRSPLFAQLRACYLAGNNLTPSGLLRIAGEEEASLNLEHLGLGGNPLDANSVCGLLESSRFPSLKSLALPPEVIDDAVLELGSALGIAIEAATPSRGILVQCIDGGGQSSPDFFPQEIVHIGSARLFNDLALSSQGLSRRHCRLLHHAGQLYIEDMMSSGGTSINGVKRARAMLSPGDVVEVGACAFSAKLVA